MNQERLKALLATNEFFRNDDWSIQAYAADYTWANWWDMTTIGNSENYMISMETKFDGDKLLARFNLDVPGIHSVMSSFEFHLTEAVNAHRIWLELDSMGTVLADAITQSGNIVAASGRIALVKSRTKRAKILDEILIRVKQYAPGMDDVAAKKLAREIYRKDY